HVMRMNHISPSTISVNLLILFNCSNPRPPTSNLFPYTTLFRSRHARLFVHRIGRPPGHVVADQSGQVTRVEGARGVGGHGLGPEGRKSTRLNSSHSQSSYAVFCLKKKINEGKRITVVKETVLGT